MNIYNVPQCFVDEKKQISFPFIFPYRAERSTIKNRVLLTTHMFSFLTAGRKEIVTGNESVKLDKTQFVLITAGNCFMSEKISPEGRYSSTLFFFDNNLLQNFLEEHKKTIQQIVAKNKLTQKGILLFRNDDFTTNFIQSLNYISGKSDELAKIKFNEIFVYLLEAHPTGICSLFASQPNTSEDIRFQNLILSHIDSNLTVNELAYLCNVSLSTFKRKFTALFNDSPTSWIRQKRMEHAAFLLKYNKERVSDIYLRLGYDNHSSFSQSFKSVYGISPKEYQLQN